jgi:3-deoxy-D-manno-octulosonic acid kinase
MRRAGATSRRRDPAPGFASVTFGRIVFNLRHELLERAPAIATRLLEWRARGAPGTGNRQSGFRVSIGEAPDLFARCARHGGWMRILSDDVFFGLRPRPLSELTVATEAYRRGIAIAEPMGAMVEWLMPGVYRGFFLTRALDGMSLWEFVRTDDDPVVRRHVLERTRAAIETMHQHGLWHADLNLHNLFVTHRGDEFAVVILDLDKARLFNRAVPAALRRRNHARLLRSIHKLDRSDRYFDREALEILRSP